MNLGPTLYKAWRKLTDHRQTAGTGRIRLRVLGLLLVLTVFPGSLLAFHEAGEPLDQRSPSVGVPARIEQLVLPGPELEVIPLEDREMPLVVRIVDVYPHGTAFRYNIEYYGLEPGEYDLKNYLQAKAGSSTEKVPPIPVTIRSILPAGQIKPHSLDIRQVPFPGGYRLLLICGGVVWVMGLGALLFARQSSRQESDGAEQKPLSLADRLRPMVEEAVAGRLDQSRQAELERLLFTYWRKRLNLEDIDADQAMTQLRQHEQAGPLLNQLETWLHRPGSSKDVDVGTLLEPYRDLPEDALEPYWNNEVQEGTAQS